MDAFRVSGPRHSCTDSPSRACRTTVSLTLSSRSLREDVYLELIASQAEGGPTIATTIGILVFDGAEKIDFAGYQGTDPW
jgi:hypothetical protein